MKTTTSFQKLWKEVSFLIGWPNSTVSLRAKRPTLSVRSCWDLIICICSQSLIVISSQRIYCLLKRMKINLISKLLIWDLLRNSTKKKAWTLCWAHHCTWHLNSWSMSDIRRRSMFGVSASSHSSSYAVKHPMMQKILIELTKIYAIKKSVLVAGLGAIYQKMPSTLSASAWTRTNTKDHQSLSFLTIHGFVRFRRWARKMRSNNLIFKAISSNTKSVAISRKLF